MQMSDRDFYRAPEVGQVHSTLEVGHQPDPPQIYSTLESRQPDFSLFDTYKQSTTVLPQPEISDASLDTPSNIESDNHTTLVREGRGPRKRAIWILVALGIVIISAAAAIGGGIGSTRTSHRSVSSGSLSDQAPSSTMTKMSSSAKSSSTIISSVSIPTMSTASSFPTPAAKLNTTLLNTTKLASVVWNINGVTEYRMWYQTEDNMIREVGKNDTGNQWYTSGQSHGPAKRGSPIAASYTGPPDWPIEISLFYLSEDGSIIFTKFEEKDQSWSPSSLSEIPADGSNLATLWFRHDECNDCSNDLLLVCQNSDDKLALFNSTANAGPQWITLDAYPMPGTGLAFNLVHGTYDTGGLFVVYQTANQALCSASFNKSQGWTVNEGNPISELSTQAPLAGFTWNVSGAEYLDIVSTGPSGVTVNYFNFTNGDWTSVPSSGVLAQVQNYSSIAANAASHIYAFQDGSVKEYQLAPAGSLN
ncbi:hypothetical protein HO133_002242 [Letharia lupina]|uniref:Fucose-specific lectin n=1 Tax=Letharia lupina TaxID=560253 RepID=A0A8H6CDA0_9LECA|nr:uncharacterized protein HO133_002242 [Letharia lupina]KAF6221387.1 hypothetical protein HO133_002242 [Letharia lupina]